MAKAGAGEDVGEPDPSQTSGGNVRCYKHSMLNIHLQRDPGVALLSIYQERLST